MSCTKDYRCELSSRITELEEENARLKAQLNTPLTEDFIEAVKVEAAHQRERWGVDHDGGKTDADWFWLIGYLAGKALHNPGAEEVPKTDMPRGKHPEIDLFLDAIDRKKKKVLDKQLHRIITIAAAAANWHLAKLGKTNMRPGIEEPKEGL